jgi:hypothetical protein
MSVREYTPTGPYDDHMKLSIRSSEPLADVWVYLTETEAKQLAHALQSRLAGTVGHRGPDYHLHIEDGEGSELTVCVLDPA